MYRSTVVVIASAVVVVAATVAAAADRVAPVISLPPPSSRYVKTRSATHAAGCVVVEVSRRRPVVVARD